MEVKHTAKPSGTTSSPQSLRVYGLRAPRTLCVSVSVAPLKGAAPLKEAHQSPTAGNPVRGASSKKLLVLWD